MHDSSPTLNSPTIELIPENAVVAVDCYEQGDTVGNESVWLNVTYNGKTGPVADYYVDIHWNSTADLEAQGIPFCSTPQTGEKQATPPQVPASEPHLPCTPYLLIGARGSGDAYTADNNNVNIVGFGSALGTVVSQLSSYYGKSEVTTYGLPYSAAEAITVASTPSNAYETGVKQGESMLGHIVDTQESACTDQKIILLGYSQGAELVGDAASTLSEEQRENIVAVGLLGDPRFNPNLSVDAGNFDAQRMGVFLGKD